MVTPIPTGLRVSAADLNRVIAQYRRSSGNQSAANGSDTQVQFPNALQTSLLVVASGTNNNAFTLSEGLWLVETSLRTNSASATNEVSIAVGSATWSLSNAVSGGGGGRNPSASALVPVSSGATAVVTVNFWHAGGSGVTIDPVGSMTHIRFALLGAYA